MQAPTTRDSGAHPDPRVRSCSGCGAENASSATFCWRCFRVFDEVPTPAGALRSRPGATGARLPAGPGTATARSLPRLVAIVLVVLGAAAAIAYVGLREPGISFPSSFAALERIDGPQTDLAAEVFRSASEAGGMEADVAFYGTDGEPVAALMWIRGPDPAGGGSEEALEAFASGFASGNNGSVLTSSRIDRTVDGIDYVCAPVAGSLPAGLCLWAEDELFWVLLDVRPGTDLAGAEDLAVAARTAQP